MKISVTHIQHFVKSYNILQYDNDKTKKYVVININLMILI